ncbi:ABC transporter permease [Aquibacillus sediminis]|uniref:ABC transporter permease n=1 Tax=Aquibacillus sediminis TaxID=2574734 RepID=UPI001108A9EA|nr:ABC transporter permease [Aquibacillus sediminis]
MNVRRLLFFMKNYQKQLQKKWKSLPLLLLFPMVIIGLCFFILVSLFLPTEEQVIQVGLVDLDQSEETATMVSLIDDASLLDSYIHINTYSEQEASQALTNGEVSAFITFPKNFTSDLYNGNSVEVPIVGDPDKPIESYIIKELIDSMTRYIASAQANILTINDYAKRLPINDREREEMVMQQFNEFLLFTLSKDQAIQTEEITNVTTASPLKYYSLSGWFVLSTIWVFGIYILLGKTDGHTMWNRIRLYGVTMFETVFSRLLIAFFYGFILAMIGFYLYIKIHTIEFYLIDYGRVSLLIGLYQLIFLTGIAMIDLVLKSKKVTLLLQVVLTGIVLFMSGAILPSLYFPEKVKEILPYIFSTEAFHWLIEVAIEVRLHAEYTVLLVDAVVGVLLLFGLSMWKERGQT